MTTPFQNLTYEDREIWLRVLQRTNLWVLSLLSRDHFADVDIFSSKMNENEDQKTQE